MSAPLPLIRKEGKSKGSKKGKKRRDQLGPPSSKSTSSDIFHRFEISHDTETSKYMPYNKLAYPKLIGGSSTASFGSGGDAAMATAMRRAHSQPEMENMWMVGFIDHEAQMKEDTLASDLKSFIQLPHGMISHDTSRKLNTLSKHIERKRKMKEGGKLKGLTPGEAKRVLVGSVVAAKLSDADKMRLKELGEMVAEHQRQQNEVPLLSGSSSDRTAKHDKTKSIYKQDLASGKRGNSKHKKKKEMRVFTPEHVPNKSVHDQPSVLPPKKHVEGLAYILENQKLRKVAKAKGKSRDRPKAVTAKGMDGLLEIHLKHQNAAKIIQRGFRRYLRLKFWKELLRKHRAATEMQRMVRGMICRTLVIQWYWGKVRLVIITQSVIRGMLSRKHSRALQRFEYVQCRKIQAMCRRWRAIRVYAIKKLNLAVLRIQMMWRGSIGRAEADRIWLSREVTKVQKRVRAILGRRDHANRESSVLTATLRLQAQWRACMARMERNDLLWQRETGYRRDLVEDLKVELEWYSEHITWLQRKLERSKLEAKLEDWKKKIKKKEDEIQQAEIDYLELQREKGRVSPRAIEQGWVEDLQENIQKERNLITELKFDHILNLSFEARRTEEKVARRRFHINEAAWWRNELNLWKDAELNDLWARDNARKHAEEHRAKMQSIADEKRKWGVLFYTKEGKPDKRRQRGKPWDPSVYAGQERDIYVSSEANILAHINSRKGQKPEGTEESLKAATDELHLQSLENQTKQYETMLKPLFDTMSKFNQTAQQVGFKGPIISGPSMQKSSLKKDPEKPQTEVKPPPPKVPSPKADDFYSKQKKRLKKDKKKAKASCIPWALLDELEAEKTRLETEKAFTMAFGKGK